jgi:hypothetical protein
MYAKNAKILTKSGVLGIVGGGGGMPSKTV